MPKTITFPFLTASEKCASLFDEDSSEEEIQNALRALYFGMLPACLQKEASDLNHVFHYIKVRDAVSTAVANKEDEIDLPDETYRYVSQHFHTFSGWNMKFADLLVLLAEALAPPEQIN